MRVVVVLLFPILVLGCNSTQNVHVTSETSINESRINTKTKVRMRQTSSAESSKQSSSTIVDGNATTKVTKAVKIPTTANKVFNKNDIDAVSQHCTKVSYEAVFIKENCKTTSERKICKSAQFGNETFMKEFNYCLTQNGWETY